MISKLPEAIASGTACTEPEKSLENIGLNEGNPMIAMQRPSLNTKARRIIDLNRLKPKSLMIQDSYFKTEFHTFDQTLPDVLFN
jgi:hypothetical protein